MDVLNRHQRRTLRRIQAYRQSVLLGTDVVVEQLGTVDVVIHPTDPDPYVNCVMPHKGVAWVRRDDLRYALTGLERLGRVPRLVFHEALFPAAFQQQLALMGLTLEHEARVMVYQPLYGPFPPDETPFGALPETFPLDVSVTVATGFDDLAAWLRVYHAGNVTAVDARDIEPGAVKALQQDVATGRTLYALAYYQHTPLGVARAGLCRTTAELEVVATAPLWHGMGMEDALIATVVREAERHGATTIFTVQPPEAELRLYHRLGFVDLTRVLVYRLHPESAPDA